MYLSKIKIKNFRSIQNAEIDFEPGKNVIVGRNNSGKSNIVQAINLIFSENSPTWEKSANITENDFYNQETVNPIYVECHLKKLPNNQSIEFHDNVNFFVLARDKTKSKQLISIQSMEALFENCKNEDMSKYWVGNKSYSNAKPSDEFNDSNTFIFCFEARFSEETCRIEKTLLFIYGDSTEEKYYLCCSPPANLREAFIQSAIIPSFRDPKEQLRLTSWSWYGKLIKKLTENHDHKKPLSEAFENVSKISDQIFANVHESINQSKIKLAFPETKISFRFNPKDSSTDLYRNCLMYIDDGFLSSLQTKGAGIQSAVLIGLFHYYMKEIVRPNEHAVLIIEEPELYLHPHARRVISNRLSEFCESSNNEPSNQVILTTHSSEFVCCPHENLNLIHVTKSLSEGSKFKRTIFKDVKEKQVFIKQQNAEMFFADFVILVEGADKYILEAIAEKFENPYWLNEYNVSVIAVGGKSEFTKYVSKLKELQIPYFLLADFDYFIKELNELIKEDDSLLMERNDLNSRLTSKVKKFEDIQDPILQNGVRSFMAKLINKHRVFLLTGELENFYTKEGIKFTQGISSKEQKPLKIIEEKNYRENGKIDDYLNIEEFANFLRLIQQQLQVTA